MLTKNNFITAVSKSGADGLLVNGDFIGTPRTGRASQGVLQLSVTAREWKMGHYFVRIIASMQDGAFLYSQDQPDSKRQHATRIKFSERSGFVCRGVALEIGTHFIHSDGAFGLKPCHGDKVTFLQEVERSNPLCDIAGSIYYQAFTDSKVLEPCMEEFRIRLN